MISKRFSVPRAFSNPHFQTVLGFIVRSLHPKKITGALVNTEAVALEDGEALIVETWQKRERALPPQVVVYGFHGLTGTAKSGYMQILGDVGMSLGWNVWLTNHRGCGDGENLAKKPYHGAGGADLAAVVRYGKRRYPEAIHIGVGFSLGGAMLLNLLTTDPFCLDAGFCINAPLDFESCSKQLARGFNRLYDRTFVKQLNRSVQRNGESRLAAKTLREFDELYTAKKSGFRDRTHYYNTARSIEAMDKIGVPTLLLTSSDDPFVLVESYYELRPNPWVKVHIEKNGGHLGYVDFQSLIPGSTRKSWLSQAIRSGLLSLVERNSEEL